MTEPDMSLTTENLGDFDNESYYVIVKDGKISGVATGLYIKEHPDEFINYVLTYVTNEMADNMMWDL